MLTFDWPAINHIRRLSRGDQAALSKAMFCTFPFSFTQPVSLSSQLAPIATLTCRFLVYSFFAPFWLSSPVETDALQSESLLCLSLVLIWINLINHTVCLDCTPIRLLLLMLMSPSAVIESTSGCVGFSLSLLHLSLWLNFKCRMAVAKHVPANQVVHNLATVTKINVQNCIVLLRRLWQLPPLPQPSCTTI